MLGLLFSMDSLLSSSKRSLSMLSIEDRDSKLVVVVMTFGEGRVSTSAAWYIGIWDM